MTTQVKLPVKKVVRELKTLRTPARALTKGASCGSFSCGSYSCGSARRVSK